MQPRQLERDQPTPWVEPFACMYWRIRVIQTLLGFALLIISVQGYWLFRLSSEGAAHVYEIRDGETTFVGDIAANLAPRPAEIRRFASAFIQHFRALNSSTIHEDAARAVSLCDRVLGERLQTELANAQIISAVRARRIRSELQNDTVQIIETTRRYARVLVTGEVRVYPVDRYEVAAIEVRPYAMELRLTIGRRRPDRPSGLAVAHIANRPNRRNLENPEG